jgi:hypothetical protein
LAVKTTLAPKDKKLLFAGCNMTKAVLYVKKITHMPYCVAQIGLRSLNMEILLELRKMARMLLNNVSN